MPSNLENSAVATGLEKVSFHPNPKERQCQRMLRLPHNCTHFSSVQFSHSVMSISLGPPWTVACQASLSITNSRSLLKLMSIESATPSNRLILHCLLLLFGNSLLLHAQFCCFLTCIQVSQEAGQVVWHSHLLQNFPQFIFIHTQRLWHSE